MSKFIQIQTFSATFPSFHFSEINILGPIVKKNDLFYKMN